MTGVWFALAVAVCCTVLGCMCRALAVDCTDLSNADCCGVVTAGNCCCSDGGPLLNDRLLLAAAATVGAAEGSDVRAAASAAAFDVGPVTTLINPGGGSAAADWPFKLVVGRFVITGAPPGLGAICFTGRIDNALDDDSRARATFELAAAGLAGDVPAANAEFDLIKGELTFVIALAEPAAVGGYC